MFPADGVQDIPTLVTSGFARCVYLMAERRTDVRRVGGAWLVVLTGMLTGTCALNLCAKDEKLRDAAIYPSLPVGFEGEEVAGEVINLRHPRELSTYLAALGKGEPGGLEKYAADNGDSPFADDALFEAARILRAQNKPRHAVQLLETIWKRYPKSERLDQVYRSLEGRGKIYPEEWKRYQVYRRHIARYPNKTSDLAMVELGELWMKCQETAQAEEALSRVVARYPAGEHCAVDEKAHIYVYYDPDRPLARSLWLLAEIARSRGQRDRRVSMLEKVVTFYRASGLAMEVYEVLRGERLAEKRADAAVEVLSRHIGALEELEEAARKEELPLRLAEFNARIKQLQTIKRAISTTTAPQRAF